MSDDQRYDADRIYRDASLVRELRDLGAVDLERPRRTTGFERRLERADRRPTVGPAWGYAPEERQ